MFLRFRAYFLFMHFIVLSIKPSFAAEPITLRCDSGIDRYYSLDFENMLAKHLTHDDIRSGSLSIFDNRYVLEFLKEANYWGSYVVINRYSGEFTIETGEPPWGNITSSTGNTWAKGECTKDVKRRF